MGMCQAAHAGEYGGASGKEKAMMVRMYDHMKAAAACASKATTCDEYERCEASLENR